MRKISLLFLTFAVLVAHSQISTASTKEEIEKRYAIFSGHKKFFDVEKWSMVRFHIVYKLTTAHITKAMDKLDFAKVKSSSGAYGILKGVTEEDLQVITDKVAENFIRRMKEEAGVEVITWSSFEDSKHTNKIKKLAQDREVYSKSQGLGYAMSYDGTPVWNKVIQIIPGGKKLAKELGSNNAVLTMYIDFADAEATATAFVDKEVSDVSHSYDFRDGWSTRTTYTYTWGESGDQKVTPVIRLKRSLGSQNSWEAATDIGITQLTGQAQNYYTFSMTYGGADPGYFASPLPYADSIEAFKGELPEVLKNRQNNKIEYTQTFEVTTTPDKYGAAVMDVTNRYFDDIITYYNIAKPKPKAKKKK